MRGLTATLTAIVLGLMLWLGAASEDWKYAYSFVGVKSGYYDLLVQGFMEGHLSMNAKMMITPMLPKFVASSALTSKNGGWRMPAGKTISFISAE